MNFYFRFIFFCLCILPTHGFSQKTGWEIGIFVGAANYLGDLAPTIAFRETKPAVGATVKRTLSEYFAYSLNVNYGIVSGNDKNFGYLKSRNLHFQTEIFEFSPQIEFNFFRFGTAPRAKKFSPYVYTGLSYFKFNPKAKFNDEWVRLQPLTTEGQGIVEGAPKKYNLWQFAIPIGAGFKFNVSDKVNLNIHGAFRSTFTDYLDDVSGTYVNSALLDESRGGASAFLSDPSGEETGVFLSKSGKQRGNPDNKDWYIFTGLTLTYMLQGTTCYTF